MGPNVRSEEVGQAAHGADIHFAQCGFESTFFISPTIAILLCSCAIVSKALELCFYLILVREGINWQLAEEVVSNQGRLISATAKQRFLRSLLVVAPLQASRSCIPLCVSFRKVFKDSLRCNDICQLRLSRSAASTPRPSEATSFTSRVLA